MISRRGLLLSVMVLVVSVGSPVLHAADSACHGWVGLWRLNPVEGSPGNPLHVVVRETGGKCAIDYYSASFFDSSTAAQEELSPDQMTFQTAALSKSYRVSLKREGTEVSGTTELLHPQYHQTVSIVGHLVSPKNDWDPYAPVKEAADDLGIVDLEGQLIEKAPLDDETKFETYWEREIEPKFYAVVEDVIYSASGGLETRKRNLEKLRLQLKDPAYREKAKALSGQNKALLERIKKDAPSLFFPNVFVLMPSLGSFDESVLIFGHNFVARLGADRLVADEARHDLGPWLARQHFQVPLYQAFPPVDSSMAARVIREGLAGYWAVTNGFAKEPTDCLVVAPPSSPKVNVADAKKKIIAVLRLTSPTHTVTAAEIAVVGADFARQLSSAYSTQEIIAKKRGELAGLLLNYLRAPAPAPQNPSGE